MSKISKILAGTTAVIMASSLFAFSAFAAEVTFESRNRYYRDCYVNVDEDDGSEYEINTYSYGQVLKGDWYKDEDGQLLLVNAQLGDDISIAKAIAYMGYDEKYTERFLVDLAIKDGFLPSLTSNGKSPKYEDLKERFMAIYSKEDDDDDEVWGYFYGCNEQDFLSAKESYIEKYGKDAYYNLLRYNYSFYKNFSNEMPEAAVEDSSAKDMLVEYIKGIATNKQKIHIFADTAVNKSHEIAGFESQRESLPNGYYVIRENYGPAMGKVKYAKFEKAKTQLDYALAHNVISKEKYDALINEYVKFYDVSVVTIEDTISYDSSKDTIGDSGVMLKIVNGDMTVRPKRGLPVVEKKVRENTKIIKSPGTDFFGSYSKINGISGWNDAADYSIGDEVPFVIYSTMPENIDTFSHFYYCFEDRLGQGFDAPSEIKVEMGEIKNGEFYGCQVNKINVSEKDVFDSESRIMTIEYKDIIEIGENYNRFIRNEQYFPRDVFPNGAQKFGRDTIMRITYEARLNKDAVIGAKGNTNGVSLIYTPSSYSGSVSYDYDNYDGNGFNSKEDREKNTKTTVFDGVAVFTYETDIRKIDNETLESLPGAVFTLQAIDGDHENQYVKVDENGKVDGWTDTVTEDNHLISDVDGKVNIIGLDDGKYEVVEVKAPNNYHNLRAPVTVTLNATLDNEGKYIYIPDNGEMAFKDFDKGEEEVADIDKENGIYSLNITNSKGISLPETGGSGVYILYAIGSLFFIGGAYLVTRKKKDK